MEILMRILVCCLLFLIAELGFSAPAIQSVSGTITHGSSIVITGTNFGTKNPAAPLVWDDASGSNILDKWTNAVPSYYGSTYAPDPLIYRTPIRGVALPHNNITKYIAGAHNGPTQENFFLQENVMMWKTYTVTAYPQPMFYSYYYRVDPLWYFCGAADGKTGDNNFKLWEHSTSASSPSGGSSWYYEHRSPDFTSSSFPGIYTPYLPVSNVWHTYLGSGGVSPKNEWIKMETEIKFTPQQDGYVKMWRNGVQGTTFTGDTEADVPPGPRSDAIGGFARCWPYPDNWRYFADVYMDTSWARIVLANSSTLSSATIKEMQIPSAWADGSITATVNLGKFTPGQTVYLFVYDSTGASNSTGYSITAGGSSSILPPTNLRIL